MIVIYRRHAADCRYRTDRYSKRCACALWLQYQDRPGHQKKISCKTNDWQVAAQLQREMEERDAAEPAPGEMSLATAIKRYIQDKKDRNFAEETVRKSKQLLDTLRAFAEARNAVLLRQVTSLMLTDFRRSWNLRRDAKGNPASHTWNTYSQQTAAFFKWAVNHNLISADPAKHSLSHIKVNTTPTMPYELDEVEEILAAIPRMPWGDNKKDRIRAVILLARYAGLAARDIAMLRKDAVHNGNLIIKRAKTGVDVTVPLPKIVLDALKKMTSVSNDHYFLTGCAPHHAAKYLITSVGEVLDLAGIPHPTGVGVIHRFRDTFAVQLILAGVPIQDVSTALGHSSIRVTEKHYLPWIKQRQEKLVTTLKASWAAQGITQ